MAAVVTVCDPVGMFIVVVAAVVWLDTIVTAKVVNWLVKDVVAVVVVIVVDEEVFEFVEFKVVTVEAAELLISAVLVSEVVTTMLLDF